VDIARSRQLGPTRRCRASESLTEKVSAEDERFSEYGSEYNAPHFNIKLADKHLHRRQDAHVCDRQKDPLERPEENHWRLFPQVRKISYTKSRIEMFIVARAMSSSSGPLSVGLLFGFV
jgi:hypothetical protein